MVKKAYQTDRCQHPEPSNPRHKKAKFPIKIVLVPDQPLKKTNKLVKRRRFHETVTLKHPNVKPSLAQKSKHAQISKNPIHRLESQ